MRCPMCHKEVVVLEDTGVCSDCEDVAIENSHCNHECLNCHRHPCDCDCL